MFDEPRPPVEYYAGLIDSIGRIRFNTSSSDKRAIGYDAQAQVVFHVGQDEYTDALLGTFFEEKGIHYSFRRTGTHRYMVIERNESFRKLYTLLSDELIQLARDLSFLVNSYLPARGSGELASKKGHLRLMKALEDLKPQRTENKNTTYTAPYFAREFDLELASVSQLEIPSVSYPREISEEYLGGFFDGRGRCLINTRERDMYDVGYSCSPRVLLTRNRVNPILETRLSNFLVKHGIQANIRTHSDQMLQLQITALEDISTLLSLVLNHLMQSHKEVTYFLHEIMPRFRRGDHHTKQGLYEIVKLAEPLFQEPADERQYSVQHFEELWENEITIRNQESIIEEPLSEPAKLSKPETYLPAIETNTTRRTTDTEFRQIILNRYDHECIITGLGDPRLLEVAHIIPWAEDQELGADPANALILNPLHHEAYDRGLFLIDRQYVIHVAPEINDEYLHDQLMSYDGNSIEFPDDAKPDREYLEQRNQEIMWWK